MSPNLCEKLRILGGAARYDASCASSCSDRPTGKGFGSVSRAGICHSWSADGRCVSLLKILLSNDCLYDCAYCVNRRSNPVERATLTGEDVADITIGFYRRNYIEGLFLSSAVTKSPDQTMAEMVAAARLLRQRDKFNGYIHLKIIPGAAPELVRQAGFLADRLSVNIELPSEKSLRLLAPQKKREHILPPMRGVAEEHGEYVVARRDKRRPPAFCPGGQSTQMIVGASPESDYAILRLSEGLYDKFRLKRVYYSAFVPVNDDDRLPVLATPPLLREHRLYQADWLLRFYQFKADELLSPNNSTLDPALDPKAFWALSNFDLFPVDVNRAAYDVLLRVPGVGVKSARRIVLARRTGVLREDDLWKMGVVMKRARFFLSVNGRSLGGTGIRPSAIRQALVEPDKTPSTHYQPELF